MSITITYSRVLIEDMEPLMFTDPETDRKVESGEWIVYGVKARATITRAVDGWTRSYTIDSAGCWGVVVENDRDAYLDDVYKEELAELHELYELVAALATRDALAIVRAGLAGRARYPSPGPAAGAGRALSVLPASGEVRRRPMND